MAQGTQIHVAAWPTGEPDTPPEPPDSLWSRQELLSRAFAAQGACYVLAVGGLLTPTDVPNDSGTWYTKPPVPALSSIPEARWSQGLNGE